MRRALPWTLAALAGVVAVLTISVLAFGELAKPQPVARLAARTGPVAEGAAPVLDPETRAFWDLSDPVLVSHGSYGAAEAWSTTASHGRRCIAVVVFNSLWTFQCTQPTIDTFADIVIDSGLVPRDSTGDLIPEWSTIRFVLHDDVIDVYVGRSTEGNGPDP